MNTTEQAQEFIENSRPAIEHLFGALSAYNNALKKAQTTVEEIEKSKQMLADLFMYRDQWSPNANHHYAQYIARMQDLEALKQEAQAADSEKLEKALNSIGATIESMSSLAGAVLQIAKQALSLRYSGKPNFEGARKVSTQSVVEVIWEGRNHAMHWDEGAPRDKVKNMLKALETDLNVTIEAGKNNCLSILGALGWNSPESVLSDLKSLVQ